MAIVFGLENLTFLAKSDIFIPKASFEVSLSHFNHQVCMILVFLTTFEFCLFNAFVDKGEGSHASVDAEQNIIFAHKTRVGGLWTYCAGYPPAEKVAPEKQAKANRLEVTPVLLSPQDQSFVPEFALLRAQPTNKSKIHISRWLFVLASLPSWSASSPATFSTSSLQSNREKKKKIY